MIKKPCGKIAAVPSILSADLCNLGRDVSLAEKAGADWFQVDVMDGHFVPNISFGPSMVGALKKRTRLPVDAHLMVDNPANFIGMFAKAGADLITVHVESGNTGRVLRGIKKFGVSAGLALNPQTPIERAEPFLGLIDLLLIMSVNPGFGGQKFLPNSCKKISEARKLINGKKIWLMVDGGINVSTGASAVKAGADCLVAGNAIFGNKNPSAVIKKLRNLTNK
ncbi:MAG: ribulose-phosphate 3-epimerase [Elusimicrobia bacterium]|nr:ribulose-phosphate 3-epimerase [Elusimicrobiota bacterium]